jgi:hypothetical protein
MQTLVKTLKFTLNFEYFSHHLCATHFDSCSHHRVLRKSLLESSALSARNKSPVYTFVYVPMCRALALSGDFSYVSSVFTRSNAGILRSNPTRGMDICVRLFCVGAVLYKGRKKK